MQGRFLKSMLDLPSHKNPLDLHVYIDVLDGISPPYKGQDPWESQISYKVSESTSSSLSGQPHRLQGHVIPGVSPHSDGQSDSIQTRRTIFAISSGRISVNCLVKPFRASRSFGQDQEEIPAVDQVRDLFEEEAIGRVAIDRRECFQAHDKEEGKGFREYHCQGKK